MLVVLAGCRSAMQPNPSGLPAAARGLSWVSPDANLSKEDLFYVSDSGADAVYVYRWRTGELKGALTGFNGVNGLCVDRAGDIWVTNAGASELEEYAHGGTQPIATLTDPGEYPFTCSVDPRSGNLAVTNVSVSGPSGNVGVYADASGTPVPYTDSKFSSYFSCAYDDKGNLYADGWDAYVSDIFSIGELHKGGARFENLSLHPTIKPLLLGGMRWDGARLAVGDMGSLYEYTVKGRSATMSGYTPLTSEWLSGAFAIRTFASGAQTVVAADSAGNPSAVQYWPYPKGGTPSATITNALDAPHGTAVSIAQ